MLDLNLRPFTKKGIRLFAPEEPGVYQISKNELVVYVGITTKRNIRKRLDEHRRLSKRKKKDPTHRCIGKYGRGKKFQYYIYNDDEAAQLEKVQLIIQTCETHPTWPCNRRYRKEAMMCIRGKIANRYRHNTSIMVRFPKYGKVYHYRYCKSFNRRTNVERIPISEAIERGMRPCNNCVHNLKHVW